MTYIPFTEEQKLRAANTDIAELLMQQGESLKRSGREYQWRDGSDKVTIKGNLWFHQYEQVGGNAIQFAKRFFNMNFTEAVEYLLKHQGEVNLIPPTALKSKERKPFKLPPHNNNMRRVFTYLNVLRGIDTDVIRAFANRKMIYESDYYHNAVFVGYDLNGKPRHAHKRGTGQQSQFKCNADGSIPEYSFHWHGSNDKIYLFEAPIDMLSYITMHKEEWKKSSYAASCSVSDRVLFQCLKDDPQLKKVYLCFDNDEKGQEAARRISDKLSAAGVASEILVPIKKDWNEDLVFQKAQENKEERKDFECRAALQL